MPHLDIHPVTRDCICPDRPTTSHTARCESAFREKFFGAWGWQRAKFYRPAPTVGHDGAYGLYADRPDGDAPRQASQ